MEGIVSNENATALMMSFNRIGVIWSSSSTALTTQVIRNEWGFKGMIETDAVAGGEYKSHFPSSLSAGVTTYCIDPGNTAAAGIKQAIEDNDDGDLLGDLRTSIKNFHYALTRTNLVNGLDADAKVVKVTPWWRYAIYGLDAAFAILTAGSAFMLWRSGRNRKAAVMVAESANKPNEAGK